MTGHWVCKNDGRIQCQDDPEISLDEMRQQLAALIGDAAILDQKKIHVITPKMCGIPAGSFNAYKITEGGYWLLKHGFVGPMGFFDCPGDSAPSLDAAATEAPADLASVLQALRATSAASHPTLVRELIGRPVRVYEQGSPITMDYRPNRTNIVTLDHHIVDIWFG